MDILRSDKPLAYIKSILSNIRKENYQQFLNKRNNDKFLNSLNDNSAKSKLEYIIYNYFKKETDYAFKNELFKEKILSEEFD